MRRTLFIIPALVGALGAAPAFAQSDDLLGDDDYPADDYTAPPAEEYAADDASSGTYDDADSYSDVDSYSDTESDYDTDYGDTGTYDGAYTGRTVAPETFHRELAPYGRWVHTPEYGRVWIPSRSIVGADFVPYATGGNWRYSNVGWTFATNWSWGWAPFHYGRWYRAPRWGWVWVPGSRWAPAWVDWRYGAGYVGWAPLPPRRYASWLRRHDYWFFCSARDMWRPNIWRYRVRSTPRLFQVAAIARRPIRHGGRARWFAGPNPRLVERVAGRRIDRVRLRPNRHERIVRRADRRPDRVRQQQRVDRPQRIERQQRVDRPQRIERQQRVERQRQQRVDRPVRRQFDRPERQQRIERQQRVERQARPERQQQVREQRQQQRVQRQQQVREQRQQQRTQRQSEQRVERRQQAREQRQQQRRERRQRSDRD